MHETISRVGRTKLSASMTITQFDHGYWYASELKHFATELGNRLNRWREAQILNGVRLRYRDLVNEYVRLNQSTDRFARIPHGRYINFMSDFLAARKGATKEEAIPTP